MGKDKLEFWTFKTNRHSLLKYFRIFEKNKMDEEVFIAPRPPHRTTFTYYYAIVKIIPNSENYDFITKLKSATSLSEMEFEAALKKIIHRWVL